MSKRNILMITPYIPRIYHSGGQNSSYYSIKYLSKNNDITLICFSRDDGGLDEIKEYCKKVVVVKRGKTWDIHKIISAGFGPYPFLVVNYISQAFRQAIQDELDQNKFDLIHCDCFYPMPNIPKTNIPIVLVDLTIEYAVYQHFVDSLTGWKIILKPLLMIDVLKLKYWETHYWKNTHTVTAFSTEDREIISKVTGRKDIQLFQNGVDKKFYDSVPKLKKTKFPSLFFGFGNMKWMQNSESVQLIMKYVWPKVKQTLPSSKLYIIGRNAPDAFSYLRSKDVIVQEADIDNMPKDRYYYLHRSWLLVAPMGSGGGTRNKFLEAMACHLPIITTPEGMGGIKITNFKESIICPLDEVANHVIHLLKNPKKLIKMGNDANLLIKSKYSYEKSVEGLNQIYEKITKK